MLARYLSWTTSEIAVTTPEKTRVSGAGNRTWMRAGCKEIRNGKTMKQCEIDSSSFHSTSAEDVPVSQEQLMRDGYSALCGAVEWNSWSS